MNKIGYIVGFFVVVSCLSGCKKTKLEGELEILEGNWVWFTSYEICSGQWSNCTYTPATEGLIIEYQFDKKGKYKLLKDGVEIEKGRIIIETFVENGPINEGAGFILNFKSSKINQEYEGGGAWYAREGTLAFAAYPMTDSDGKNYFYKD